jgi:hypothetical protein
MRRWVIPLALLLGLGVALLLRRPGSAPATSQGPSALAEARPVGDGPTLTSPLSRIEREADERAGVRSLRQARSVRSPPTVERPASDATAVVVDGPSRRVRGVLLEADGRAADQAWIRCVPGPLDGRRPSSQAFAVGRDGSFTLDVTPADVIHLEASGPTSRTTRFAVTVSTDGDLGTLSFDAGCSVGGRITCPTAPGLSRHAFIHTTQLDPFYEGVPDAEVLASLGDAARYCVGVPSRSAQTDADGVWRQDGLAPGRYLVEITSAAGCAALHRDVIPALRRIVQAPATDVSFELDFSILHVVPEHGPGVSIASESFAAHVDVDVMGENGTVSNAWSVPNMTFVPDPGVHELALRPSATYRVRVQANGYLPREVEHTTGASGETVLLPVRLTPLPSGHVDLEALAPGTQDHELLAEVFRRGTTESVSWDVIRTTSAGAATIPVPAGTWDLVLTPWNPSAARGTDYHLTQVVPIVLEAGESRKVVWDPPQGGRFVLHAHTRDGEVRAFGLTVERSRTRSRPTLLAWDDGEREQIAWSDALVSGRAYTARDVYPAGTLTLVVTAAGCEPQEVPVRIEPRTVTPVSVTLVPR